MKASAVLSVGCLLVFSASVSFGAKKNVEQPVAINLGETAASENGDIAKVMGRGVGINETEALKDAYRDAVERAVGLFVDAETIAKNDEIVKDQILTQSNAYIQKFEKIDVSQTDGLYHVKILAEIKKAPLVAKVSSAMPTQTVSLGSLGESLYAQVAGGEKSRADSLAAAKRVFDGYDPVSQLIGISLAKTDPIVMDSDVRQTKRMRQRTVEAAQSEKIKAYYLVKLELDRQKYFNEFLPKFKEEIERIAIGNVRNIRFSNFQNSFNKESKDVMKFLLGDPEVMRELNYRYQLGVFCGLIGYRGRILGRDSIMSVNDLYIDPRENAQAVCFLVGSAPREYDIGKEGRGVHLVVIEEVDSDCTLLKARQYDVDVEVGKYLSYWLASQTGAHMVGKSFREKEVVYNVVLNDSKNEEIAVSALKVGYGSLMNLAFTSHYQWGTSGECVLMITPFVRVDAKAWYQWVAFDLNKDDLAKVAKVTFEKAN